MSSRSVLASPPQLSSPMSKRLKRSSSSASVASLPTPPRTISKRKRSPSKQSSAVDSTDDSDGSVYSRSVPNKKRKTLDTVREDDEREEEDAFWLGTSSHEHNPKPAVAARTRSPSPTGSMSPDTVPAYRRQDIGLVSPPPSRRQPARKVKKLVIPNPSPIRRDGGKGKGKAGDEWPIRDSPNNPFLDSGDSSLLAAGFKTPPRRKGPVEEKQTLTYVFRGQKLQMPNPLYNYQPPPTSLLPPEHPDFSPSVACPPKLLFPEAHRRNPPRKKRPRSPLLDDEDELQGDKITPMGKLTFEPKVDNREEHLRDTEQGRHKRLRT